jgi:hypothetical protein
MAESGSDDGENEWWGRPQDDPALRAAVDKRLAEFRAANPPVDCWIDRVAVELFLGGVRRALVDRSRAMILFFGDDSGPTSSLVYLRSDNPYDMAEAHLGIPRVAEVRDESDEADEIVSSVPREREERAVAAFRRQQPPHLEVFQYLRSALKLLRQESAIIGQRSPVIDTLLQAAGVEIQDEQALALVRSAVSELEGRKAERLFGDPALADCRRAIEAMERSDALQSGRRSRRDPDGKSGG